MPRYQNLKDSMNPYTNNKPVLSSSDRLKDKRDKTIYKTQKTRFQKTKNGNNKSIKNNVNFYNNGKVRSTNSYKMNMQLSRGAVLCDDCNKNGILCTNVFTKNNLAKINMGNSQLSTLNLGTGLKCNVLQGERPQVNTTNLIISDVSGTWGSSSDPKEDSNLLLPYTPYGYATNLFTIPRNLNGNGIFVDVSNVLFNQDDGCIISRKPNFLKYTFIKTFIIYEGPLSKDASGSAWYDTSNVNQGILNQYCIFGFQEGWDQKEPATTGQIIRICHIGQQKINDSTNSSLTVDTFKVFIELNYYVPNSILWQGAIGPSNISSQPIFRPNGVSEFTVKKISPNNNISCDQQQILITSKWAAKYDASITPSNDRGRGIQIKVLVDQNQISNCSTSQVRKNRTKQNYLSCIENKTKFIQFNK